MAKDANAIAAEYGRENALIAPYRARTGTFSVWHTADLGRNPDLQSKGVTVRVEAGVVVATEEETGEFEIIPLSSFQYACFVYDDEGE